MTLPELLGALRDAGVVLSRRGDRLHFQVPHGQLRPEMREALARHKQQLLTMLAGPVEVSLADPEGAALHHIRALECLGIALAELDHFFERAAIVEHDGGLTRTEAEVQAVREALELGRLRRARGAA